MYYEEARLAHELMDHVVHLAFAPIDWNEAMDVWC
jgi:hypothetical protein